MKIQKTGTRLDPILESVAAHAIERRRARGGAPVADPDPVRGTRFVRALGTPGELSFIAECKRRSPSVGELTSEVDLGARAEAYARGGAAALSILTEQDHFRGHPDDLIAAAKAGLPRLRKDFLLDVDMVVETVAMGADAVLLLAVCLDDAQLRDMRAAARELGLAVLLEVHDEEELERGLRVDPDCLGVNARDLRTFEVDLGVTERLLPLVPPGIVRVAESGIHAAESALRMRRAGADAVLVGEALMKSGDPAATLRQWRAFVGEGQP
ncbi:Indole-3-glycerol phosphate synthase [Planctomycetes bacterium Poly30]|uniref:indole-3-glycerol-phosphate synthase n=1 Tax=Saltatorellus ferox TaxID=2528018 RepID=A0A518EV36_9BACT|nr:Indole-3-glycerol phosphate synthase [Planctomycetes bacterium Poly30]